MLPYRPVCLLISMGEITFSRMQERNTTSIHQLRQLPVSAQKAAGLAYPSPSTGPHYRPLRTSLHDCHCVLILF